MNQANLSTYTSFDGHRRIASGSLLANVLAAKQAHARANAGSVWIFDDATGQAIDVDMRGSEEEVTARLAQQQALQAKPGAPQPETGDAAEMPRGRGRPRLGVVAREVTLLPRHWEWLAAQPGGASVALRKLVEDARRASEGQDRLRRAHERAYHFMQAIAGDLPGFEEATRALFTHDADRFQALLADWPQDVREHALRLGFGDETLPLP